MPHRKFQLGFASSQEKLLNSYSILVTLIFITERQASADARFLRSAVCPGSVHSVRTVSLLLVIIRETGYLPFRFLELAYLGY